MALSREQIPIEEKDIMQISREGGIAIDRVDVMPQDNMWIIHFKACDGSGGLSKGSDWSKNVWEERFRRFLEPQAGALRIDFRWDFSLGEICGLFWVHIVRDLCKRFPVFCGCLENVAYRIEDSVSGGLSRLVLGVPSAGAQRLLAGRSKGIAEYFLVEYGLEMSVACELSGGLQEKCSGDDEDDEKLLQELIRRAQAEAQAQADIGAADGRDDDNSGEGFYGESAGKGNNKTNSKPLSPSVLLGKEIKEPPHAVSFLRDKPEEKGAVVAGRVLSFTHKSFNSGASMLSFGLTDNFFTVPVKLFLKEGQEVPMIKDGMWVKVRGSYKFDNFTAELTVLARDIMLHKPEERRDGAAEKRVELHAHTKMSEMDGIATVQSLVQRAGSWGHEAIAITDHGVVQAFPEAVAAAAACGIKIILGMEGYLILDNLRDHEDQGGEGLPNKRANAEPWRKRYHIILLAQNSVGLKNLYRLVTASHLEHFSRRPCIPRSLLMDCREGLLLGSACEAGELVQGILEGVNRERLLEVASFYDYLEIQPLGNNAFLVESGRVADEEGLRGINRTVLSLGRELGIPVAATCDVHFLDKEDEVFRRILTAGLGYSDADRQAPLFLRTTGEMLDEFAYLGEEEAFRVVVRGPREIAARVEALKPFPDELFAPEIEGAQERIESLAWARAAELYGDPLPPLVESVLTKELKAIIGNGFSVLYLIAHLLVKKSNEDGYLVGSRGSVGSSLVATLTGITEVNPLPPHYRCPACRYCSFVEDGSVRSGADLPDEVCPECGEGLLKDGHDIPFETFMGFDGDKVPDIDLNFSGAYQGQAHKYTEEIFGKENVFRAGTISTLASKTAFGYVKNYLEERDLRVNSMETARLVEGCEGVKKTTGQHPGGLMVLPKSCDVHDFTPLQHPANDMKSGVITTHFDYHSISGRLVKLDILGHDDPTVIRMLEDLTGVRGAGIPLDDAATLSLFSGVEALEPLKEPLDVTVGTLGVPEFGTKFVRQMLEDLKPSSFSHLVQVSGLSHGTDVWLNNAQTIIRNGQATVSEIVCCRDDIMIYLIRRGLEPGLAFKIMESVRKGKGLWPEAEEAMKGHGVPDWYVESCLKIKYMFPKAHAVAYVTMAFRIAWFKINYPEAFYVSFFSVRATDFDAELICRGLEVCRKAARDLVALGRKATSKESGLLAVLEVAMEMFCRGLTFRKVDLWLSAADTFLLTPEGLLPPFSSLQGVGETAARNLVDLREVQGIHCVEDLQNAGLSKPVIDVLRRHGCFEGLAESNQLSLF
ncbi:MAG: PolC-type DNA polymerase III [Peptococcaceae bacterium]|nr:PolC-type DNA polymerase III [Peptococcaceae bacterium]